MKKGILFLADGFEETEAITVIDILRRAEIEIKTVAVKDNILVKGAHNIEIKADQLINDLNYNNEDILILPGGMPGTKNLDKSRKVHDIIEKFYKDEKYLAAICAAPMVYGKLGYFQRKRATSYPGFEKFLKGAILSKETVVVDGKMISSRGLGTAIDFSLKIVEILKNKSVSDEVKERIIY